MQAGDGQGGETGGRSVREIFLAFLRLGLTSFGGPVAHLGYFRACFVERRRWVTDKAFVDLVGLCQFLPGPSSSQVAFGIGLMQAGWWGGLAAWLAFTLPSALLMVLFAGYAGSVSSLLGTAILHGLKVVAVAVVAHAVWCMARTQAPDLRRIVLAVAAAILSLSVHVMLSQPVLILLGGMAGLVLCRADADTLRASLPVRLSLRTCAMLLAIFAGLLVLALPAVAPRLGFGFQMFGAFYRTGALVFGGGHVVLPLLRDAVVAPGWISANAFLAGYGAAQALPGPLFSLAAYLGALLAVPPNGLAGAAIALLGLSLPGLLLVAGALPFWDRLRAGEKTQAALQGVNATVVGILGAALYDPLWIGSIATAGDALLALAGFALLAANRLPVLAVVMLVAGAGTALALA